LDSPPGSYARFSHPPPRAKRSRLSNHALPKKLSEPKNPSSSRNPLEVSAKKVMDEAVTVLCRFHALATRVGRLYTGGPMDLASQTRGHPLPLSPNSELLQSGFLPQLTRRGGGYLFPFSREVYWTACDCLRYIHYIRV